MSSNTIKLKIGQENNSHSNDHLSTTRIILKRHSTLPKDFSSKNINSKVTFHETKATSPCNTDRDASIDIEAFSLQEKKILPNSIISSPKTSVPTSIAHIKNFSTTISASSNNFGIYTKELKHRASIEKFEESKNKIFGSKASSINNLNNLEIRDIFSRSPVSRTLQNYGFTTQRYDQFRDYFQYSPAHSRQSRQKKISRNNSLKSQSNPRTINEASPRNLKQTKDEIQESGYERSPLIAEERAKTFQNKVTKLNSAFSRKQSFNGEKFRKEFLRSDNNIMKHASLLKERQHSQIINLKFEDEGFFNKIAQIYNDGIKELEINSNLNNGEKGKLNSVFK